MIISFVAKPSQYSDNLRKHTNDFLIVYACSEELAAMPHAPGLLLKLTSIEICLHTSTSAY